MPPSISPCFSDLFISPLSLQHSLKPLAASSEFCSLPQTLLSCGWLQFLSHEIMLFYFSLSISFQWFPVTFETSARVVVMAQSQRRCHGSELPARPVLPDFISYPFSYSSATLASLLFFERYQVCSHFRTSALLLGMLSSRYLYRTPSLQSGVYPAVSSCPDFPIQNNILFPVYFFIILITSWC